MSKLSNKQIIEPNQPTQLQNDETLSKTVIRRKVWNHLEKYRLVNFPRPVYGRIPNFKNVEQATLKLLELNEFVQAKSIEINPDKPLEFARILTLQNRKELYVPCPQLKHSCFLKKISIERDESIDSLRQLVNRNGIDNYGEFIDFNNNLRIDLLIVGSVACSLNGYRIGKGKGYADLEFVILKEMKAINDETPIVTIVHDSQVFDNFPDGIFDKHDVPLDYILTPTRLIKIERKQQKPTGIYWELLTQQQIDNMPILQNIHNIHEKEGRIIGFKQDITDNGSPSHRTHHRSHFDFSLHITNIDKNIRLRQFKDALIQYDIKPSYINWFGYRGYCYLHYIKPNRKQQINDNNCNTIDRSFSVDNVIEILKNLKLTPNPNKSLNVKVMEPITRIETTDVTSV